MTALSMLLAGLAFGGTVVTHPPLPEGPPVFNRSHAYHVGATAGALAVGHLVGHPDLAASATILFWAGRESVAWMDGRHTWDTALDFVLPLAVIGGWMILKELF